MSDRILIVDDEPSICYILSQRLTREGYSCTTASGGLEGLQKFGKAAFPLIISDIRMQPMNGLEFLANLRAEDPGVLVIMVTAHPEVERAIEAMRLGAYDFLIKPVNLDLLVLSVKKAFEKKRLEEELDAYRHHLEHLVRERTGKLERAYRVLKKAHADLVKVLAEAIDARDPYTRGHSDRVKTMSLGIARHLGFSEKRLENLEHGALLHDIGKIGIRDEILRKPAALSPDERRMIREHPSIGAKIVDGIGFFKEKVPIIRHHHEHFDGKGYPDGLAGEAIPLEARIIAVPDAFDAMVSARPNSKKMPLRDVLEELKNARGTQFDPAILDLFLTQDIYQLPSLADGAVSRQDAR